MYRQFLNILMVLVVTQFVAGTSFAAEHAGQKTAVGSTSGTTQNTPATAAPAWASYDNAQDAGEIPPVGKILEVNLTYDRDHDPIISIGTVYKKNGNAPLVEESEQEYTLQVLDRNAKVLTSQGFTVPYRLPDPPPETASDETSGEIILPRVNFTLTVPWQDAAAEVRVLDIDQVVVSSKLLTDIQDIDNQPNFRTIQGSEFLHPSHPSQTQSLLGRFLQSLLARMDRFVQPALAQAVPTTLDITFIGDNYLTAADLDTFHKDVNRFVSHQLTYEPFKSRASQILYHYVDNTSDLGCQHDPVITRGITCDNTLVTQAVNNSGVPYDKIVVIVNDSNYGGSGGLITISYNGSSGPQVFVHEFGHSLGSANSSYLIDEYDNYGTNGPILNKPYYNCYSGEPPGAAWNGIVGVQDYATVCYYPNWYEPSHGSIMKSLSYPFFNSISQNMLNPRIDFFAGPSADAVLPIVAMTSPSVGASVSKTVTVTGTASDDSGVTWAELWVDSLFLSTDYIAPYSFSWDTTRDSNGNHAVQIKAHDAAGNIGVSALTTVNVANAADPTAPTVFISSPTSGSTVSGTITVSAAASDNVGVSGVQFKLDGANIGAEDAFAPYSIAWDTSTAGSGSHNLTAVARDSAGNSTTSDPITVTVFIPLSISGVSTTQTTTTATVKWTTNVASTGTVTLGTGQTLTDANSSTSHLVKFTGLIKATRYSFTLNATSVSNGTASSTGSFRTKTK